MFTEPAFHPQKSSGWVEVICGPMFSGKTEELLRRLRRAKIANIPMAIFKPAIDVRYGEMRIMSHDANFFPSMPLQTSKDILKHRGNATLIAIDEAQFFDEDLPNVVQQIAQDGVRVIVAGLDMDYMGNPFGTMPQILAVAEYITKLSAICPVCGGLATFSFRKVPDSAQVLLGEKENYEPRCRGCFNLGMGK
ncbi:MAG: thymidine kinase [Bacteroidetes bacterium]|nr:thymidine kinase [Bacteroidota bacterium]